MRLSGWSAVDLSVTDQGQGRYHLSHPLPNGRSRTFSISRRRFNQLFERLEPFRREAVPFTKESVLEVINRGCPEGVPVVTDAGAIWVRWIGPGSDQHYLADFGCAADRNANRNKALYDAMRSLPVPLEG